MILRHLIYLLLFWSIFTTVLGAYPLNKGLNRGVLSHWDNHDGLPQNSVTNIVRWKNNLWLGTEEGLVRFDGDRFKTYSRRFFGFVGDYYVQEMMLNQETATLWIHFGEKKIIALDLNTMQFKVVKQLKEINTTVIYLDRSGKIWVGTDRHGLCSIDNMVLTCSDLLKESYIRGISEQKKSGLWIATNNVVFGYQNGKIIPSQNHLLYTFQKMITLKSGSVLLGTVKNGLLFYDGKTLKPYLPEIFKKEPITALYQGQNGSIWVAVQKDGLYRIKLNQKIDSKKIKQIDFLPFSIASSILEDQRGNIWIGTWSQGLYRLYSGLFTPVFHKERSQKQVGMSIYQQRDHKIILGSFQHGILDQSGSKISVIKDEKEIHISGSITSITEDYKNNIRYFAHYKDGLFSIDQKGHYQKISLPLQNIWSKIVYFDSKDRLWVGTFHHGLYFRDKDGSYTHVTKSVPDVLSINTIIEGQLGDIWFGGYHGLYRYYNGAVQRVYPEISGKIYALYFRGNDLYCATGIGLYRIKKSRVQVINSDHYLPVDKVFGITFDHHNRAWISSNRGVFSIDEGALDQLFDGKKGMIRHYTSQNGLISDEGIGGTQYGIYTDHLGQVWVAMLGGFSLIDPEKGVDNRFNPKVLIKSIEVNHQKIVDPIDHVVLKPDVQNLRIKYSVSALDFSREVSIRYRLKGIDREWRSGNQYREIQYNTLPAGVYHLNIQYSDSLGCFSQEGINLEIVINEAFYRKIPFMIAVIIFAIMIIFLLVKWRIYLIQKRNRALENLVAQRTEELQMMALKDPLTGLFNRRFVSNVFQPQLEAFIAQCSYLVRSSKAIHRRGEDDVVYGIFLFDIDHFKQVNDTLGHDVGDLVLKQFTTLLQSSVRQDDLVIRWGGEEFLVILKQTVSDYLPIFAKKIREKIAQFPFETGGDPIFKTCSIGYGMLPFIENQPELMMLENLIYIADLGLYYAKGHGRNQAIGVRPTDRFHLDLKSIDHGITEGSIEIMIS